MTASNAHSSLVGFEGSCGRGPSGTNGQTAGTTYPTAPASLKNMRHFPFPYKQHGSHLRLTGSVPCGVPTQAHSEGAE